MAATTDGTRDRTAVEAVAANLRLAEAERRARYLTDVLWHVGAFLIINAGFWVLDLIGGGGLGWSLWITGLWGVALAFHLLAFLIDGRGVEARATRHYLHELDLELGRDVDDD
jgi:hypothetical protein